LEGDPNVVLVHYLLHDRETARDELSDRFALEDIEGSEDFPYGCNFSSEEASGEEDNEFSYLPSVGLANEGMEFANSTMEPSFGELDSSPYSAFTSIVETNDMSNSFQPQMSSLAKITDFSPEWDYTEGGSKLLIMSPDFHAGLNYFCMFDQVEVPAELVTDGVLRCRIPMHHKPGTVSFCVTRGNFRLFSDVYAFEYRMKEFVNQDLSSIIDDRQFKLKIVEILERLEREVNTWNSDPIQLTDRLMDSLQMDLSEEELEGIFVKILSSLMEKLDNIHTINSQDYNGMTLLHYCVLLNYRRMASALIRLGANKNIQDKSGCTPFQLAHKKNDNEMSRILADVPTTEGKVRDLSPLAPVAGLIDRIDTFQLEDNSPLHTPTFVKKFRENSSSSPRTPVKSRVISKLDEVPGSPVVQALKDYRVRRVEKAEDDSKKRISKARDSRIMEKRR
jgi:hypothetical protein